MLPQFSNTMSVLFSYSQDRLKETFGDGIRGILTSINHNLGFSARVEILALSASRYYTDNKIPFLPTVELLYPYNKDERKNCPNLQSMSYLKTIIYLIVKILEPLYSGGSFYKITQEPPSKNKTSSSVSGCTLYPLDSSF